jgi:hypothetical protein
VEPGETIDISVELTSPTEPGTHRSTWQMQAPDGATFGAHPWAEISVPDLLAALHEELYFSAGGGLQPWCGPEMYSRTSNQPDFHLMDDSFSSSGYFCLFELPVNEVIDLTLNGPDNEHLGSLSFEAIPTVNSYYDLVSSDDRDIGWGYESEGITVMNIGIYATEAMPYGTWHIVVDTPSMHIGDSLEVSLQERYSYSVGPDTPYNPFNIPANRFYPGEYVVVSGAGFDGRQTVPLGIYYVGNEPGVLIDSTYVTADTNGRFSLRYRLKSDLVPGQYEVFLATDEVREGLDGPTSVSIDLDSHFYVR